MPRPPTEAATAGSVRLKHPMASPTYSPIGGALTTRARRRRSCWHRLDYSGVRSPVYRQPPPVERQRLYARAAP